MRRRERITLRRLTQANATALGASTRRAGGSRRASTSPGQRRRIRRSASSVARLDAPVPRIAGARASRRGGAGRRPAAGATRGRAGARGSCRACRKAASRRPASSVEQAGAAVPLVAPRARRGAAAGRSCSAGRRRSTPAGRRRSGSAALRTHGMLSTDSCTAIGRSAASGVLQVEDQVLDLAQRRRGCPLGRRFDRPSRRSVEHGAQLVGVLGVGLGQDALGLGDEGLGRLDRLAQRRASRSSPGRRPPARRVAGRGRAGRPSSGSPRPSPKTASSRSTASLRCRLRNRSIALSITTCLASPVARSVAVTLRIPFRSRSSRTRIWLPAGTSASPSILNSPTRVLYRVSWFSPWKTRISAASWSSTDRRVDLGPADGQRRVALDDRREVVGRTGTRRARPAPRCRGCAA